MEQTNNIKLPLIDVNNAEDLKITFINFVKMICGVDDSSALQILDRVIKTLQTTKQDKLTAGENITIVNNVISGVGGVNEEDVMEIVENNAEQTDVLEVEDATEIPIGTSATFDATSDEQIPTSKAVSDLMAGGGSKLYNHKLKIFSDYYNFITTIAEPFTTEKFKNYLYNYYSSSDTGLVLVSTTSSQYFKATFFSQSPYSSSNTEFSAYFYFYKNTLNEDNTISTTTESMKDHYCTIQEDTVTEL